MDGKQLIEVIKEEDLLRHFFECNESLIDYEHVTSKGVEIENEEQEKEYLNSLGLSNFEDKGGRSDTSEFWNIVYFPDYDVHLKISGWYDSYGGYEHDYTGITEVKPKEVTKTIYE